MGCTQAEIHRLMDALEYELFIREPRPRTVEEVKRRFDRIAGTIREMSLQQLFKELGL